jgi:hypothetical protein
MQIELKAQTAIAAGGRGDAAHHVFHQQQQEWLTGLY